MDLDNVTMGRAGATTEGFDSEVTMHDMLPGEGIEMGEGVKDMERVDSWLSNDPTALTEVEVLCDPTLQLTIRGDDEDENVTP